MKKILFVLPIFGMLFTSCEKDENIEDLKEPQSQQKSLMMSGFHLETIDNGSDGQILFFDSAEAYYNVQENLFNQPNAYIDSYQDQIPTYLNDDQLEEYLNDINYNEDAIYEGFEQSLGFNSFRVVKSIIKNKKALFPGNGFPDRLIIKTKGYLWKRGKWRNRAVWLVSGFTSKKNQGNHSITWWNTGCTGTGQTQLFPARTKCVAKYEYDGGNPKGSNIVYIDNTLYAYHGQGTFTFTVDFYPDHEAYTITY